jgi:hypothetical protein
MMVLRIVVADLLSLPHSVAMSCSGSCGDLSELCRSELVEVCHAELFLDELDELFLAEFAGP